MYRNLKVALAIPCLNEAISIGEVIAEFRRAFPYLTIYVFDNNSTDGTASIAKGLSAEVINVPLRGKGNVVRRIFCDIEADIYVMVDGDSTYEPSSLKEMVDLLIDDKLDMVVGLREIKTSTENLAYRKGHQFGNQLLTKSVSKIFGGQFTDMLSGYRVFSRRYAKSFPALSTGFEIETELTIHALELSMPTKEVATPYRARPQGSNSKLSTYKDGWRILSMILKLYIAERPLAFYGLVSFMSGLVSIGLSLPIFIEYIDTGLVPRFPTAILSASIMVCSILALFCGLILDNVTRGRRELKYLAYQAMGRFASQPD
jgi:glycosyltransferase involved in cell wall biosynthesis